MRSIYFVFLMAFFFASSITHSIAQDTSEPRKLVFAVNSPGAAPYLYFDEYTQEYVGVVVDLFRTMEEKRLVSIEYIDANRTRSEQFVYSGKADVFLSSLAWLKYPEKVASSIELSPNLTFLYSLKPFPADFNVFTLTNEQICTRRAYVYPNLTTYLNQPRRRVDSSSQRTGVKMMLKGRCDLTVMNQYNALSLFNSAEFCNHRFYRSPKPVDSTPNALIFSKNNGDIVPMVNEYIRLFKTSGKARASFQAHNAGFLSSCP